MQKKLRYFFFRQIDSFAEYGSVKINLRSQILNLQIKLHLHRRFFFAKCVFDINSGSDCHVYLGWCTMKQFELNFNITMSLNNLKTKTFIWPQTQATFVLDIFNVNSITSCRCIPSVIIVFKFFVNNYSVINFFVCVNKSYNINMNLTSLCRIIQGSRDK